jgi:hypothetical protein
MLCLVSSMAQRWVELATCSRPATEIPPERMVCYCYLLLLSNHPYHHPHCPVCCPPCRSTPVLQRTPCPWLTLRRAPSCTVRWGGPWRGQQMPTTRSRHCRAGGVEGTEVHACGGSEHVTSTDSCCGKEASAHCGNGQQMACICTSSAPSLLSMASRLFPTLPHPCLPILPFAQVPDCCLPADHQWCQERQHP